MRDKPYRISRKALEDLENIWSYTYEKWSPRQADVYYHLILEEFERISLNPRSGRPMDLIKEGYRASKVKSHLIFFRVADDKIVEIIRILHERMDLRSRMNES